MKNCKSAQLLAMQGKPTAGQVMFFHQQKGAATEREREKEGEREGKEGKEGKEARRALA